ncbi:hypothetical protein TNCV_4953681 [Trichonephila clavipes]|nr:hypothetical protein TNCV_4953681 [Trichonephila clavipes]
MCVIILQNRYVREVLQLEVVLFLQGILGAILQQDNARSHVAKTVRDFCSARHVTFSMACLSPDMSPIHHVWDLVGRCPATSKNNLLLRIQAIWH